MKPRFCLAAIVALVAAAAGAETVNFDEFKTGSPPPGWTGTKTGKGNPRWEVVPDAAAPSKPNVLKQSGEATYPLCFKDDTSIKDGFVEVKFKPLSGKEDQAGGVIWRCQDSNNYYVARANALENNLTIYHTIKGRRVAFKNVDTRVAPQVWHTLRVDFLGNKFSVALDGKELLQATDDSLSRPGKVGLWTKADSLTLFDDFAYGSR